MSKYNKNNKELVSKVFAGPDLKVAIKKAVTLIGGFRKVVKKGDEIVVKPNYNTNDEFPGSSDPEFVKAVVELLYEYGILLFSSFNEIFLLSFPEVSV